jgi:histidinol dehydrogenase
MEIIKYPTEKEAKKALKRIALENKKIIPKVQRIIDTVKAEGDKALFSFAEKFDGVLLSSLKVSEEELNGVEKKISPELKSAINTARKNIFKFHSAQKRKEIKLETSDGITCWRKSIPIEKVGLYIPGGSAPLFSTLLMLALPAQIAGCNEIIICTPPQKDGNISNVILYVAKLLGLKNIFKTGGAQAIAAMALGTESIPKVYKIFGPGNQWVTTAKQIVNSFGVAVDMPAGPSEVLVIADSSANPNFVAADLLSQAEHGPDSQAILITTDENLLHSVNKAVTDLRKKLSRNNIIEQSLRQSKLLLVNNLNEAINISNNYAPEHLILSVNNADDVASNIINAGSVFLGNYSPESAGDYASGTNHTLPTNGFAKAYSGLSTNSFTKEITFQKLSAKGLQNIANTVKVMANAENLDAHKLAIEIREKTDG